MPLSSLERVLSPHSYRLRQLIADIIERSKVLGLPERDATNAREALDHNEAGVGLDTVLTQLFEYEIAVDDEFLLRAHEACKLMQIEWDQYAFVEGLAKK